MKTFLKVAGASLLVLFAVVGTGLTWLSIRKPASRAASSRSIEVTPARLARGEYLVHHVADCLNCHSDHLTTFGMPVRPGSEGQGGFVFDKNLGIPGVVAAQNITPDRQTGIGAWTDGEVLRAMREGVDRNGDALFPMMPYAHFRSMSDEDAQSIVVYLRTLKPIHHAVPARHIDFPVNLIIKFKPQPVEEPVIAPDPRNAAAYGGYLGNLACVECHTPHDSKNQLDATRAYAGGWTMLGPWGRVVTANLTPDSNTFIGRASKAEFIGRFRAFEHMDASNSPAVPPGRNTIMPWLAFSRMSDHDLGAIYDYLRTVKPIANRVNSFPDAKM